MAPSQTEIRKRFIVLIPAALFYLFGLTACNLTGLMGPFASYLKKKTGLAIEAEKISAGAGPLTLEAKGLRLKYSQTPLAWEATVPDLKVFFGWNLTWETLPWPQFHIEKIVLQRPELMLRMPQPKGKGDWTQWLKKIPTLKEVEINDLKGRVEVGQYLFRLSRGIRAKASFSPDQGGKIEYQLQGLEGEIGSRGLTLKARSQGMIELNEFPERPRLTGAFSLAEAGLHYKSGNLDQVSGSFQLFFQDNLLKITAAPLRLRGFLWKKDKTSLEGQGRLSFSGVMQQQFGRQKKRWEFSGLEGKWESLNFDFRQGNGLIKGLAAGKGRLEGPAASPTIRAEIHSQETELDFPPVRTEGLDAEILVQGKIPDLSFSEVRAKASQTEWTLPKGNLSIINPQTRLSADFKGRSRKLHLKNIGLETDNWGSFHGDLFFNPDQGPGPQGNVRVEKFPLPKFLAHFFPKAREPFPKEIPCQGTVTWSRENKGGPIGFKVSLIPAIFSFKVPKTDWEGEAIKVNIDTKGEWDIKDHKITFSLSQNLNGGSFSRSPWIFLFDQKGMESRLEGIIETRKETGSIKGVLDINYDPLGQVRISAHWPFASSPTSVSGTVEVQGLPLERGFPLLVGKPLSYRYPSLEYLSFQGLFNGRLSLQKEEKDFNLRGRISSSGMGLKMHNFHFQGIDLDLPLLFSTGPSASRKTIHPELGFIRIGKVSPPFDSGTPIHFPLTAGDNRLSLTEAVDIPLWGGEAELTSFCLTDPFHQLRIDTALSLTRLDLGKMFRTEKLSGILSGDLETIRLNKEKIIMEGLLKAEVFEGTVEGENWVIEQPFSSNRSFRGDLSFSHLNLEPITRFFSFGKITGYIEGEVNDLIFRNNLPERFRLLARTQNVPKVSKVINVTAIENIGFLGTGWGELDVLRKGLNRFITEYVYREMGIFCSLEEDLFTLRGTIIEDGVEYLVRKPGFFGIDIINKNPDNEILFSDIMDRLQRIGKRSKEGTRYEVQ
ncbi:MAG: hypothetical protein AB1585_05290 [Thermodesulfobacteriota bacterium]